MLRILKPGFFTTVQDAGRFHYRDKGVPVSGVMDSFSFSMLNMLLENEKQAAVLEITMTGPTLQFEVDTYFAGGGANFSMTLNNKPIQNYKVYKIVAGDILSYGKLESGFRSYLAVKGGFRTPVVLGSQSFFLPLTNTDSIKEKTVIPYMEVKNFDPKIQELKANSLLKETVLEVYGAPEYTMLNRSQLTALFFKDFTIAKEYNRMAYQLNETVDEHGISMLTSATLPGTVQLTPAGKLIILMKDGQTTGGYPRILQLSDRALAILSQKKFGDPISFKLI